MKFDPSQIEKSHHLCDDDMEIHYIRRSKPQPVKQDDANWFSPGALIFLLLIAGAASVIFRPEAPAQQPQTVIVK